MPRRGRRFGRRPRVVVRPRCTWRPRGRGSGGAQYGASALAGPGVTTPGARRDRHRDERHARPVDEVRVGRRVEQDRVGARTGREVADVAAPQRPRAAEGRGRRAPPRRSCACRARRARCRTPSTSCSSSRGCSSSRARRVTPASIARRASGYGWRVEKSVAGRNVATVSLPASAAMSSSSRYVQWSTDAAPSSTREPHAGARAELVRVDAQAEPRGGARLEHRARLVGVERALLAEHVDPARVRRARGEHLAADERDVVVGVSRRAARRARRGTSRRR